MNIAVPPKPTVPSQWAGFDRATFASPASTPSGRYQAELKPDRFENAFKPASLHFGQKNKTEKTHASSIATFFKSIVNGIRSVVSTIEYCQANIRLGFVAVACLLTFLPMPGFCRRYIQRRAFFGPIKVSDLSLLRDKSLQPKINEHTFNMSSFKNDIQAAGLKFNPDEDNVRLHSWHIPAQKGKPTVLFNHGRGTNISYLGPVLRVMSNKGYGVVVYDYPGFGKSEGEPGEEASYKAAIATSKHLHKVLGVPPKDQVIVGYSMGSAVATDVARRLHKPGSPYKALVLINTFPSLQETFRYMQDKHYNWTKRFLKERKISLQFNSADKLKQINNLPILILQGEKDVDTPIALIKKTMLGGANKPSLEVLENAKHRLVSRDYETVGKHFFAYMDKLTKKERETA